MVDYSSYMHRIFKEEINNNKIIIKQILSLKKKEEINIRKKYNYILKYIKYNYKA